MTGLKFRGQHPVGPLVLDFCCVEYRLGIELDGEIHDELKARDEERDVLLKSAGYRVLRFTNTQVIGDLDSVLTAIRLAAADEPLDRPAAPGRDAGWR